MTKLFSLDLFALALTGLALLTPPRAFAAEPVPPTTGPAATRSVPADKVSLWGEASHGVQARLIMPGRVERDALVPIRLEIVDDPDRLPSGADRFDTFLLETRVALTMTNVKTKQSVTVTPPIPDNGIPAKNVGADFVRLDGTPVKPFDLTVALRPAGEVLEPGDYDCVLTYPAEGRQPRWVIDPTPPGHGWWSGKFQTAPLRVTVIPPTTKTRTVFLPTAAHLVPSALNKGFDLRCDKPDVQPVDLPVRNGCYLGTRMARAGGASELMGGELSLPEGGVLFDDPTNDPAAPAKPGDVLTYTVEIFETERAPEHMWMPVQGSDGYKTLWQRTFKVKVREKGQR